MCWPTSPARRCCARSSPRARTCTRRPRPRCSASRPSEVGFAERSKAKMVNFGIAYGLSAFGLADRLQISREEAAVYIQRYFERFPAVKRFIDETIANAERDGFVTTLMGRRRAIPELRSDQRQRRSLGERLAVNTVIQGTAADIIKLAMVRCHAALAEAGMESPARAPDPRRAAVRGPDGGDGPRDRARPHSRCAPPSTSTRRWPSTSAWARTGWRRSRGAAGDLRSALCSGSAASRCCPEPLLLGAAAVPSRCSPSRCFPSRRCRSRCSLEPRSPARRRRCSRTRGRPTRCLRRRWLRARCRRRWVPLTRRSPSSRVVVARAVVAATRSRRRRRNRPSHGRNRPRGLARWSSEPEPWPDCAGRSRSVASALALQPLDLCRRTRSHHGRCRCRPGCWIATPEPTASTATARVAPALAATPPPPPAVRPGGRAADRRAGRLRARVDRRSAGRAAPASGSASPRRRGARSWLGRSIP